MPTVVLPPGALSRSPAPGTYALTLEGDVSNNVSVLYFTVKPLDPVAQPPFDWSVIPPSQNVKALPSSGRRGFARFPFDLAHMNYEWVGMYATMPDGQVIQALKDVRLNSADEIDKELRVILSDNSPVGMVAITSEGNASGKKAIAYVRLMP